MGEIQRELHPDKFNAGGAALINRPILNWFEDSRVTRGATITFGDNAPTAVMEGKVERLD